MQKQPGLHSHSPSGFGEGCLLCFSGVFVKDQEHWALGSYLQFIFMVRMRMWQIPKFLSEPEAVFDMLWGYKVFCNFNTTVQIMNLERTNKH